ncbi:hypothetical protein OXX79_000413 [Metschnikowia pulcherrima]
MVTLSITIYYGGPGKSDASGRRPVHHAGEIPHLGQVYTPQPLICTPARVKSLIPGPEPFVVAPLGRRRGIDSEPR